MIPRFSAFLAVLVAMILSACATIPQKTVYDKPVYSTEETYATDIAENYNVTVVVVGADWCPPCRTAKAKMKDVLQENLGEVKFVILDSDKYNTDTLVGKNVEFIPYFIVFDNGKQVFEGNSSLTDIIELTYRSMQQ